MIKISSIRAYDPNDGYDEISAGEMAQLAVWRSQRFFSAGGLMERYERLGDDLVQYGDIATWLVTAEPGLNYKGAIDRFVTSVKHGGFGWRYYGKRRAVAKLIDLDGRAHQPPAKYRLRPSSLTVEMCPELMRARGSVWAQWLRTENWPVPNWLPRTLIEGKVVAEEIEQTGAPGKPSSMYLVMAEHERRVAAHRNLETITKEAEELARWKNVHHPNMPRLTEKTIRNKLYQKRKNCPK